MSTYTRRHNRLLTFLLSALVVLGIVAMHHLAGGGHLVAHAAPHAGAAAPQTPAHQPSTADRAVAHAASAVTAMTAQMASLDNSGWEEASSSVPLLQMCLAVLIAGLALLAVLTGRSSPPQAGHQQPWRAVSSPFGRGPPRLLLARLCVLRI